jgi:hypothetical protein
MNRNALAIVPKDKMPSKVIVGPHMCVINESIRKLDGVLADLVRVFPSLLIPDDLTMQPENIIIKNGRLSRVARSTTHPSPQRLS